MIESSDETNNNAVPLAVKIFCGKSNFLTYFAWEVVDIHPHIGPRAPIIQRSRACGEALIFFVTRGSFCNLT